jgi:hypothetical protein
MVNMYSKCISGIVNLIEQQKIQVDRQRLRPGLTVSGVTLSSVRPRTANLANADNLPLWRLLTKSISVQLRSAVCSAVRHQRAAR